jgi:hypothetical protein
MIALIRCASSQSRSADRVGAPLVEALGREAQHPAGHRDGDPVVGEVTDQRVGHFGAASLAKYGHQRLVPSLRTVLHTVAGYLDRGTSCDLDTDRLFVVLKGPNRGQPLSVRGLDEISPAPAAVPGWRTLTCHSCATPA